MARTEFITLRPHIADLAQAVGGNRYVHCTGTRGVLVRCNAHQSSYVVSITATRIAGVMPAVVAALIAEAPAIAEARRAAARDARAKAAQLLVEADKFDAESATIDAALAHARERTEV